MDIFYKDKINAGVMHVISVPELVGVAALKFVLPKPEGRTFVNNAIITSLNYTQRTNTQFQQSLDNVIYVYSFGDQMGDLTLTGLAFSRSCDGSDNGVRNILRYYQANRASRSVSSLEVVFASEVIRGYLVGMSMATIDVSSGLHNFNLALRTVPSAFHKDRRTADAGGDILFPHGSPFEPGGLSDHSTSVAETSASLADEVAG